jgi:pimeloyl-ACP methyl ester carboxylesterase
VTVEAPRPSAKPRPAAAEESAFLIPIAAQLQLQYQRIRCPIRIVHGKSDQLIEADQSRRLHEALHGSLLHLVEDAGHMVTYIDTSGIADAVAALALSSPRSRNLGREPINLPSGWLA